jgi:HK97 gp10 family phage protein
MALRVSAEAIYRQISTRIVANLNATAEEAMNIAREKAPVRKVFRGSAGVATVQSGIEAAADKQLRRDIGMGPGPVRVQRNAASAVHSIMKYRQLSSAGQLRPGAPTLTSRGRNELSSGRANFSGSGGTTLGGRLRGEIHMVPAEGAGPTWVARVVSPTAYAKYVEFGTRHARKQPYMRPALSQVRESFRARMRAAASIGR